MTDEQSGEQVGRLWVEIGGDDSELAKALNHAKELLAQAIAKEYKATIGVQFENAGGGRQKLESEIRQSAARAARSGGQAVLGQMEQAAKGISVKEVKVEKGVKIDKDTLTSAIQGSLNGHAFKINLDQNFIHQQIQEVLGRGFSIGVGGSHAAAPSSVQTQRGITPEQRAEFDSRFTALKYSGNKGANLGKLIEDWDGQIRRMTGRSGTASGPTEAFESMIDQLGDKFDDWADKVEKLDPESFLPDVIRKNLAGASRPGTVYSDVLAARRGAGSAPASPQVDQAKFIQQAAQVIAKAAQQTVSEREPRYDYGEATLARAKRAASASLGGTSIDALIGGLVDPSNRAGSVRRAAKTAVGDQNVSSATLEMINRWIEGDLRDRPRTSSSGSNRGGVRERYPEGVPQPRVIREVYAENDPRGTMGPVQLRVRRRNVGKGVSSPQQFYDKDGNPLNEPLATGNDPEADAAANSQLGNKRENVRRLRGQGTFTTQGFTANLEGLLRTLERGGLRNVLAEQKTGNLHTLEATGGTEEELRQSQLAIDTLRSKQGSKRFSLEGAANQVTFLKPAQVAEVIIRKMFGNATVEGGESLADKILADPTFQGKLAQAVTQGGKAKPYNLLGGNTQAGNAAPGSTASLTASYRDQAAQGPLSPAERAMSEAIGKASNAASRRNIELGVGKSGLERALDLEKDPKVIGRNIAEQIRQGSVPSVQLLADRIGHAIATAVPDTANGETQYGSRYRAAYGEADQIRKEFGLLDEDGGKVKGRQEDSRVADQLIDQVTSALFSERRITAEEGDRAVDLAEAGRGRGRVAKKLGKRATGRQSKSVHGGAEFEDEYVQPTTSLDQELQRLAGVEAKERARVAGIEARRPEEALKATAKKFGVPFKPSTAEGTGIDSLAFTDEPQRKAATKYFNARLKKSQEEIVPSGAGNIESRRGQIAAIKAEAEKALADVAGHPFQGPFQSTEAAARAKNPGITAINDQRSAIASYPGLSDAARKEALEVLDYRTAQARKNPNTRGTKDPLTGGQAASRYADATGQREAAFGGSGGAGGPNGSAGGGFGGFPIPLPVSIVSSIPLTIEGLVGKGRGGVSAGEETGEVTPPGAGKGIASQRLDYRPRVVEGPLGRAKRRKNINARNIGTEVDQGRVYSYAPDEEPDATRLARAARSAPRGNQPQSATERDFLAALAKANPGPPKPPTEEQAEIKAFARQRRLRTRARQSDPLAFARYEDLEEQGAPGQEEASLGAVRARLRSVNRRIPRRSFGASLTDLISSIVPGSGSLKEQLRFGDLAAREAAEIERTSSQRSATRTTLAALPPRIEAARAKGDTEQVKNLLEVQSQQKEALKNQNEVIRISTARFKEFSDEATKGSRVLKSFGASAIGGAAAGGLGALQFAAGAVIAQPLMAAVSALFSDVIGPAIEQSLGFPGATSRAVASQAQTIRGAGGREDVALAQLGLQTGNTLGQAGETVNKRAALEAGNQALAEQFGTLRASLNIDQNGGPNAALNQSLGGLFGGPIGGTPSIDEIIGKQLGLNPSINEQGRNLGGVTYAGRAGAVQVGPQGPATAQQLDFLAKNLDGVNKALAKGSNGIDKFVSSAQIGSIQIERQAQALQDAGFTNIAAAVRNRQGVLTENGHVVTDPNQVTAIFKQAAEAATKTSPEDFLAAQAPNLRAQQYLSQRQLKFNLEQGQVQSGLETSANPFLPAKAGFAPRDAKQFKNELAGVQTTFTQLNKEAGEARTSALELFASTHTGDTADVKAFADAMGNVAKYGQQISKIELGAETAQAALAAHQYDFSIRQAKRSLQDALALAGKITGATQNLGAIERQQFELQRQSQALSLGQSQRQINFQRAIAGLNAPGLTGEERAARIQQAKLEADYAQKQLDIQKKLFGLGGKQFQITADRNVQDLTTQLGLLQEGRQVTLKTAVAQKQIQALTALQARENKKVQAFYQSAVDATGQIMQLEAQLVANTEINLNKVGSAVLNQYRKLFLGLQGYLNAAGGLSSQDNSPDDRNAGGALFTTSGPHDMTVGEAGAETVAVLRNPRPFTGGLGGGGSTQIVIDLRGANVSDANLYKKLVSDVQAGVERGLAKKGGLYGLS